VAGLGVDGPPGVQRLRPQPRPAPALSRAAGDRLADGGHRRPGRRVRGPEPGGRRARLHHPAARTAATVLRDPVQLSPDPLQLGPGGRRPRHPEHPGHPWSAPATRAGPPSATRPPCPATWTCRPHDGRWRSSWSCPCTGPSSARTRRWPSGGRSSPAGPPGSSGPATSSTPRFSPRPRPPGSSCTTSGSAPAAWSPASPRASGPAVPSSGRRRSPSGTGPLCCATRPWPATRS
jgi:hypothetical protein